MALASGVVGLLWEVGRADEATMDDLSKEFGRGANGRRGQWGCGEFAEGGGAAGKGEQLEADARRKTAAEGVALPGDFTRVGDGDVLPAAN